ncbi:MAG: PQQ-binding-like beta-propeller repeat protein [Planctomycetes bacterium]|nr:PQQ-binding-like beta-propeller repeat protein [Planctomycetota bacterium]
MGNGGILNQEEVDFLIDGGGPSRDATARPAPGTEPAAQVTMRGDLDKINLADIFQTLALSKLEGLLCISTQIDKREIYFRDGLVRCLMPQRLETLRLGQRLVRAGLITTDRLRSALLEQKRSQTQLGTVLVQQGVVAESDIEDIVANQLQEELFSLFTWRRGSFEFYKGPPTDQVLVDRIEKSPEFESNGLLLEVARRADEWERIFAIVGSIDELLVAQDVDLPPHLGDDHARVYELADGSRNVRDLADAALLELFDCAIVARELIESGACLPAPVEQALDTAEHFAASGDVRRALMSVDALLQRRERPGMEWVGRIAELLARCGERRRASDLLRAASISHQDPTAALALARQAREMDRRSLDALRHLHTLAKGHPATQSEAAALAIELIDALLEAGAHDEALDRLHTLEAETGDLLACRPRLARGLARLGRPDEAVEALLGLASTLDTDRDKRQLATVYEQILRIDYRRKDVARSLRSLHASKLARRVRLVAIACVLAALMGAGVLVFRSWQRDDRIAAVAADLHSQLRAETSRLDKDLDATLDDRLLDSVDRRLREIVSQEGPHELLTAVQQVLNDTRNHADARRKGRIAATHAANLDAAHEQVDAGALLPALATWEASIALGIPRAQVDDDIRANLARKLDEATERLGSMRTALPGEPEPGADRETLDAVIARLDTELAIPNAELVRQLLQLRDTARIRDLLDRDRKTFGARLDALQEFLTAVDRLRARYVSARADTLIAEELTPLYHRAQQLEKTWRFAEALDAYRQLAANHPEEDELKARFRARVERYASILRLLDLLAEATQQGDFASAQGQLRALRQQYPDVPFDDFVRLPVRIETQPPGAQVFVDGSLVGRAPLVAAYRPGAQTTVRVELEGYHVEETVLSGDRFGKVHSLLARRAAWTHTADATIDSTPLVDTGRGQIVYSDRAGHVVAVRIADGEPLWHHDTSDVSGMLTAPVAIGSDLAAVGSVDGPLRALRLSDGSVVWQLEGFATEATPALGSNGMLVVATLDRRLAAIRPSDHAVVWSIELPGPVAADLLATADLVVTVTTNGHAIAHAVRNGEQRWRASIGRGAVATPAQAGRRLFVVSDDGRIVALDLRTGEVAWHRTEFAGLVVAPVVAGERLFVAEARSLHVLDTGSGRTLHTLAEDSELRGRLSADRGLVFAADARGTVRAIDQRTLTEVYLLPGRSTARAPVVALPGGALLAAFEDRRLQCFRDP